MTLKLYYLKSTEVHLLKYALKIWSKFLGICTAIIKLIFKVFCIKCKTIFLKILKKRIDLPDLNLRLKNDVTFVFKVFDDVINAAYLYFKISLEVSHYYLRNPVSFKTEFRPHNYLAPLGSDCCIIDSLLHSFYDYLLSIIYKLY